MQLVRNNAQDALSLSLSLSLFLAFSLFVCVRACVCVCVCVPDVLITSVNSFIVFLIIKAFCHLVLLCLQVLYRCTRWRFLLALSSIFLSIFFFFGGGDGISSPLCFFMQTSDRHNAIFCFFVLSSSFLTLSLSSIFFFCFVLSPRIRRVDRSFLFPHTLLVMLSPLFCFSCRSCCCCSSHCYCCSHTSPFLSALM